MLSKSYLPNTWQQYLSLKKWQQYLSLKKYDTQWEQQDPALKTTRHIQACNRSRQRHPNKTLIRQTLQTEFRTRFGFRSFLSYYSWGETTAIRKLSEQHNVEYIRTRQRQPHKTNDCPTMLRPSSSPPRRFLGPSVILNRCIYRSYTDGCRAHNSWTTLRFLYGLRQAHIIRGETTLSNMSCFLLRSHQPINGQAHTQYPEVW